MFRALRITRWDNMTRRGNRLRCVLPTVPFALLLLTLALTASVSDARVMNGNNTIMLSPMHTTVALRLQRRLERRFDTSVTLSTLIQSVWTRSRLLNESLTVTFQTGDGEGSAQKQWETVMRPEWLPFSLEGESGLFEVSADAIAATLPALLEKIVPQPSTAEMRDVRNDHRVQKGAIVGRANPGYLYDANELASTMADALRAGEKELSIPVDYRPASLVLQTGSGTIVLERLAMGRSNFARSPFGRIANIKTALDERLDGVVVNSGATFSFNNVLVGASSWALALVIVNGKDLAYEPGGGICQASTTTFRAALLAGLPVRQRKNHSLYVTYYEKYGVGVDATVYSGRQDFTFENDTGNPLVIAARTEGDDAFVEIFGIPDGRSVRIDGPFFAGSEPDVFRRDGKRIQQNEIVWTSDVSYANGPVRSDVIRSRYLTLPRSLAKKFTQPKGLVELTGDPAGVTAPAPVITALNGQL